MDVWPGEVKMLKFVRYCSFGTHLNILRFWLVHSRTTFHHGLWTNYRKEIKGYVLLPAKFANEPEILWIVPPAWHYQVSLQTDSPWHWYWPPLLWWDYSEGGSKCQAHCLNFDRWKIVVKISREFPYKEIHVTFWRSFCLDQNSNILTRILTPPQNSPTTAVPKHVVVKHVKLLSQWTMASLSTKGSQFFCGKQVCYWCWCMWSLFLELLRCEGWSAVNYRLNIASPSSKTSRTVSCSLPSRDLRWEISQACRCLLQGTF